MAKYTIYPGKSVDFISKQGTRYIIHNRKGKLICYLNGKKCKPTKEILSRFSVAGGRYTIYTDGGCVRNPGRKGGYGIVIIEPSGNIVQLSGGFESTTNNRMELMAAIEGIKYTPRKAKILLYTDSKYLIQTMQGEYQKSKNLDLWTSLEKECKCRKVDFKWVKGHSGNALNEVCDKLAKAAVNNENLPDDKGYDSNDDKIFRTFLPITADATIPPKGKINNICSKLIDDFYQTDDPSFRDYAKLKTGGKDIYSDKGIAYLQSICKANLDSIAEYIDEEKTVYVLRWNCRGLSLKDSIIKVLVDSHIRDCAEKYDKKEIHIANKTKHL